MTRFLVIGLGNMGLNVVKNLQKNYRSCQIVGVDKRKKTFDLPLVDSISKITLKENDCSILCIKPQDLGNFCTELYSSQQKSSIGRGSLISILAGVDMEKLKYFMPQEKICRAMPNLSMEHTPYFTAHDELSELTKNIFPNNSFRVENDRDIDIATIINGSGPALLMNFCRIMNEESRKSGISKDVSEKFVLGALNGTLQLYSRNVKISQICSKGGTTEAALNEMKKNNFDEILRKSILKSIERGYCIRNEIHTEPPI